MIRNSIENLTGSTHLQTDTRYFPGWRQIASVLLIQAINAIHFPPEPEDYKTVQVFLDTVTLFLPVHLIHISVMGPNSLKPFQIAPIGLPCSLCAFPVLQILEIDPDAKTGNNQDQDANKLLLCVYQNQGFLCPAKLH
jgi:hypothetical protein